MRPGGLSTLHYDGVYTLSAKVYGRRGASDEFRRLWSRTAPRRPLFTLDNQAIL